MNAARLIRFKVYMDRARVYVGYAQFMATILVFLKVYEDTRFGQWFFARWWAIIVFFVLFFMGLIIVGYLDKKYVRPLEQKEITETNPIMMDIKRKVDQL